MPRGAEPLTEPELRAAALRLLGNREHSQQELARKLARRCDDPELIERVIQSLAEDGYQSDTRTAQSKARVGVSRRHGPMKIRHALKQSGLGGEAAADALEELEVDWHAQARDALHAKFGEAPAADRKEQARRARFLQSRGYPINIVASLVLSD